MSTADKEYQKIRREKIKSGELIPNTNRRSGISDFLKSGKSWFEECYSQNEANNFQRQVAALSHRSGYKVKCKTLLSVDTETEKALFIVKVTKVES